MSADFAPSINTSSTAQEVPNSYLVQVEEWPTHQSWSDNESEAESENNGNGGNGGNGVSDDGDGDESNNDNDQQPGTSSSHRYNQPNNVQVHTPAYPSISPHSLYHPSHSLQGYIAHIPSYYNNVNTHHLE